MEEKALKRHEKSITPSRRQFLLTGAAAVTGTAVLAGCGANAKDVGAVEDLMREHGILRRCMLVYTTFAERLRVHSANVPLDALGTTATLFRRFGEDYHERKLEEVYIFPSVAAAKGTAASYVQTLIDQHNRGRQITDYLLGTVKRGRIADADALASVLDSFVLMYRYHTAREDTVVFPAWKQALSGRDLEKMGDRFEDIERAEFGRDGFEEAAAKIAAVESQLGTDDLSRFTAPIPPLP
jgi:hemerythrin-like domain-containing protein